MNSLEIFKQLFLKHPNEIKNIFTNVTVFVEDQDKAIADFLSVEYPELVWLIRILHVEYNKQLSTEVSTQQQAVKNIAHLIMLTVDEMGILDYGQKDQNNFILNTLETHLLSPQNMILQEKQEHEDIISIDDSNPDIDLVYQNNTTFNDIAQHISQPTSQTLDKNSCNI